MCFNQRRSVLVLGGIILALGGCNVPASPKPIPISDAAECPKDEFDIYLWQKADVLDGLDLPRRTRVIEPGMAVTMDFRPDRLNFAIGKTDRIERIYCG